MAVLVRPLVNTRSAINERFPNRDKTSDGWIGDYAHSQGKSSHNPDDTGRGNAEWDGDSDSIEEVRALDVDSDLRDEYGWIAEEFVQWFIGRCRAGEFPWVRYVIYKKRIWHKRDGYVTRAYTGSNPHDKHFHINSDFSQSADNADPDLNLERTVPGLSQAEVNQITGHVTAQATRVINALPSAKDIVTEMLNTRIYIPYDEANPSRTLAQIWGWTPSANWHQITHNQLAALAEQMTAMGAALADLASSETLDDAAKDAALASVKANQQAILDLLQPPVPPVGEEPSNG